MYKTQPSMLLLVLLEKNGIHEVMYGFANAIIMLFALRTLDTIAKRAALFDSTFKATHW